MGMELLRSLQGRIIFLLEVTNTLPMAQNLTVPLYQDKSSGGKMLSFVIRSIWVWGGGLITFILAVPLIVAYLIYLALPIVSLVMIVLAIFRVKL
jgi:hypothetical protein